MTRVYTQQVTREEMKEYGEFLRSMRKSIGLTQKQMAEKLGVFYTTVYRWESGRITPNGDIYEIVEKVREIVREVKKK